MSISLFTGILGTGKTNLAVDKLANDKELQGRPLYVDGVPDLKIPHEQIPEGHSMEDWHVWAPTGAILFIDEAQRIFRPRANGSKVPPHVAALETHRHKGIDIFVVTQHPRLIDANLKSFVEHHYHISKTFLGRKLIKWVGCKNPDNSADYKSGTKIPYRLKKRSFELYQSAEEHTKIKAPIPWVFWFFLITLFVTGYFIYKSYTGIVEPLEKPKVEAVAAEPLGAAQADTGGAGALPPPSKVGLSVDDYVSRIPERPETKPMYDNVRQVQTFEFPNMCIQRESTGDCKCYSHQATVIKDIPKEFCKEYVENGIFNPYQARTDSRSQPASKIEG